jgi:acetyltransferase-like isoleucine patch superfamily enzyme
MSFNKDFSNDPGLIERTMKPFLKVLVMFGATIAVAPALLGYRLGSWLLGSNKAFPGWSQAFSLLPGLSGIYLRRAFYRQVLPDCGTDACICFGTIFSHPTASIGRAAYIGPFCSLGDVTLQEEVLLGSHVSVTNGSSQHGIDQLDVPIREQPGDWPRITIGADTWIGDRAIVMANVGKHCVIGAGSVVTKPVPDYAIAVGAPARVVKFRTSQTALETGARAGSTGDLSDPQAAAVGLETIESADV